MSDPGETVVHGIGRCETRQATLHQRRTRVPSRQQLWNSQIQVSVETEIESPVMSPWAQLQTGNQGSGYPLCASPSTVAGLGRSSRLLSRILVDSWACSLSAKAVPAPWMLSVGMS